MKNNKMQGKVRIDYIKELSSLLFVNKITNLDKTSLLGINPNNKMYSNIDIVEAPEITIGLRPWKDAFVRSLYPRFNYGDTQDLIIGRTKNPQMDIYRIFIDFDLRYLPRDIIYTKAKLVLYPRFLNNINTKIDVYTVDMPWDEYGITWDNAPNRLPTQEEIDKIRETNPDYQYMPPELIATYDENMTGKRSIEIDISHVIQRWREGSINRNGLMLMVSDEDNQQTKGFFSRETRGQFVPRLLLTYYDPNPPSQGRIDCVSTLRIPNKGLEDDDCEIIIEEPTIKNEEENCDCELNVRNASYVDCNISIAKGFIDSEINVTNKRDIDCEIGIVGQLALDENAKINVNKPYIDCIIDVSNNFDLNGNIEVTPNINLDCQIGVRNYFQTDNDCTIDIRLTKDCDCEIGVRNHENLSLNSEITVTNASERDLDFELNVLRSKDCNCELDVRVHKDLDLPCQLSVKRDEFLDLGCIIETTKKEDVDCRILISQGNVFCEMLVMWYKDLDLDMSIRQGLETDNNCELLVLNAENTCNLTVRRHEELDTDICQIEVLPSWETKCELFIYQYFDTFAKTYIKIPFFCDMSTFLEVKNRAIQDCEIVVRNNEITDNNTIVTVRRHEFYDKNCYINIRRNEHNDCNSLLPVRNYATSDKDCGLNVLEDVDLSAEILIVNEMVSDLDYTLFIRPNNKMFGKVEIFPPTEITYVDTPVKDSYTRKDKPYFNYGDSIDMFIGSNSSGDLFETFIQFNQPKIPKNHYILDAKIRLYPTLPKTFSPNIEMKEARDFWHEMGITYRNKPYIHPTPLTTYSDSTNKTFIDISIMNIIEDWLNGNILRNGFSLNSNLPNIAQNISFFTRESQYPPRLIIKYYDLSVVNNGRSDLPSEIFIYTPDNIDLDSEIIVPSYENDIDLNCKIEIKNDAIVDCEMTVNQSSIEAEIEVRRYDYLDIDFELSVRNEEVLDESCIINVYNVYTESEINVRNNVTNDISCGINIHNISEIDTEITVQNHSEEDIDCEIHICRCNLDCYISITNISCLSSNLKVRRFDILDSNCEIEVIYSQYLDCILNVYTPSYSEKDSILKVINYKDLSCVIYTKTRDNYDLDMSCKLMTTNGDAQANILVMQTFDLDVNLEILPCLDTNCIINTIYTDVNDLDFELEVVPSESASCKITTLPTKDINCKTLIRAIYQQDNNAILEVVTARSTDCIISVVITDHEDVGCSIGVLPCKSDECIIDVLPCETSVCKILIREPYQHDSASEVIVRRNKVVGYVFIF